MTEDDDVSKVIEGLFKEIREAAEYLNQTNDHKIVKEYIRIILYLLSERSKVDET